MADINAFLYHGAKHKLDEQIVLEIDKNQPKDFGAISFHVWCYAYLDETDKNGNPWKYYDVGDGAADKEHPNRGLVHQFEGGAGYHTAVMLAWKKGTAPATESDITVAQVTFRVDPK